MADWIKIGIKAGIVATATAVVIVILSVVQFPALDLSAFTQGVAIGKAVAFYWFPTLGVLFTIFISLLALELIVYGIYIALITIRWVLKVNE